MRCKILLSVALTALLSLSGCGGGSSGGSSAVSIAPPPPPPPPPVSTSVTVSGSVAKGLVLGGVVLVLGENNAGGQLVDVETSETSDTGEYSVTFDLSDFPLSDFLYVSAAISNADMICDSPIGCITDPNTGTVEDVAFGDTFSIPDFDPSRTGAPIFLTSVVPLPAGGESVTVNLNIFSHLTFLYADQLATNAGRDFNINAPDVQAAQTRVANIFDLADADFSQIDFVDLTRSPIAGDEEGIYAAMLAGGLQGALDRFVGFAGAAGYEAGFFDFIFDFSRDNGELTANDGNPNDDDFLSFTLVSLDDIHSVAARFDEVVSSDSNAFITALQRVEDRLVEVRASRAFATTENGQLLPPLANEAPIFNGTSYQGRAGEADGVVINIFDNNGVDDSLSVALLDGLDADFFTLEGLTLIPNEPFSCEAPQDVDGNFNFELNMTVSDGEFTVQDLIDIEIFTADGSFCDAAIQGKSAVTAKATPPSSGAESQQTGSIAKHLAQALVRN